MGRENVLNIHVTLLPYISATAELKTKPTQHSVKELRSIGLQPDVILCRSDHPVPQEIKDKITLFCDVEPRAVIAAPTVDTIYEVPLLLQEQGIGQLIIDKLDLDASESPDMDGWIDMVDRIKQPKESVPIAIVGKYVELADSYCSVREALHHAGLYHGCDVDVSWIRSEDLESDGVHEHLQSVRGIVVPGGFGPRGVEGMIKTARYARERDIPYLGLCLGMQVMVIEYARYVLKSSEPNSTEFDVETGETCRISHARPEERDRHGWHHALGRLPLQGRSQHLGRAGLRRQRGAGTTPPPLRNQQRLQGVAGG